MLTDRQLKKPDNDLTVPFVTQSKCKYAEIPNVREVVVMTESYSNKYHAENHRMVIRRDLWREHPVQPSARAGSPRTGHRRTHPDKF